MSFADEIIAAPIGAVLLGILEVRQDPNIPWHRQTTPDKGRIAEAVDHVAAMSFPELLEAAFSAAWRVGPWMSDGASNAAWAYSHVEIRRPIAQVIEEAFAAQLWAPIDLDAQEWWCGDAALLLPRAKHGFENLDWTYGSGEFPWNGLRTVTAPPTLVHESFVGDQEIPKPVGRWALPVDRSTLDAQPVFTVHRPADWAELITRHPKGAQPGRGWWGLPGNQDQLRRNDPIFDLQYQHAAVRSHSGHLVPNWSSVATEYSGVHLSWGGWITSEGFIHIDEHDFATGVRYWFSDRTFWLRDVFGEPLRLEPPEIEQDPAANQPADELALLNVRLGRAVR